jgi:hypothetical protein
MSAPAQEPATTGCATHQVLLTRSGVDLTSLHRARHPDRRASRNGNNARINADGGQATACKRCARPSGRVSGRAGQGDHQRPFGSVCTSQRDRRGTVWWSPDPGPCRPPARICQRATEPMMTSRLGQCGASLDGEHRSEEPDVRRVAEIASTVSLPRSRDLLEVTGALSSHS